MTLEDGEPLRREVIATALAMNASGINVNTSGNVSARCSRGPRSGFVLAPSAIPCASLAAADLVFIDESGTPTGTRPPSSEWQLHFEIYAARADVGAIVHTHSAHATALACQGLGIPAFHYMVATAGGPDIPLRRIRNIRHPQLANRAVAALEGRTACLLAHHGVVACGTDLQRAWARDRSGKSGAHVLARAIAGRAQAAGEEEMKRVLQRFESYGR